MLKIEMYCIISRQRNPINTPGAVEECIYRPRSATGSLYIIIIMKIIIIIICSKIICVHKHYKCVCVWVYELYHLGVFVLKNNYNICNTIVNGRVADPRNYMSELNFGYGVRMCLRLGKSMRPKIV